MLAKLIKREWINYGRNLALVQSIGLGVVVALGGMSLLPINISTFFAISSRIIPFCIAAYIMVNVYVAFYKSLYGKGAYFTHSLPISVQKIYAVKIVFAIAVWFIEVLLLLAQYALLERLSEFKYVAYRSYFLDALTQSRTFIIIAVSVAVCFLVINSIISVCFAIVLANRYPFDQLGSGVGIILSLFTVYVGYQILSLLSTVLPGLIIFFFRGVENSFSELRWQFVWKNVFSFTEPENIGIGTIPLPAVILQILFVIIMAVLSARWIRTQLCLR